MPFQSAIDDLKNSTLRSVAGLLGKLAYLAELRKRDGSYRHWGLRRVHGEAAAQAACEEAHQSVLSRILRTPLRRMVQDATVSSEPNGVDPTDYVRELASRTPELLPSKPPAGAQRHLSAVLHALAGLLKPR